MPNPFIATKGLGWTERITIAFLLLIITALPFAAHKIIKQKRAWQAWASEHCEIIGHMEGDTDIQTGLAMTIDGKLGTAVTTSQPPDKTGYKCDDGMTYWR